MDTVLHVLNTGGYSGAENVVITIIKGLSKAYSGKYRLVYVSPKGTIGSILEKNGIEYEPIDKVSIAEIKRVIRKTNPTVIHAHDFTASVICAAAAGKTAVISHIHNNSPWLKTINLKTLLYAIACSKVVRMLGVSNSVFDEYVFGQRFKNKEVVIGNPIDINSIREKAEAGNTDEKYDVIFLGRLSEAKNPLRFLTIMQDIRHKRPGTKGAIVGDGELRDAVEDGIRVFGLEDTIMMKGFQSDPYGYLKSSKVMCMPSTWEGFGLAAVEALALGVPVVASPVGGLKDIITDDCGRLSSSDEEFSNEICCLLDDSDYYDSKTRAANERAEELNNIDTYINQIASLYSEMIRQNRAE